MDNFITLDQAIAMTTLYRQQKELILGNPFKGKDILSVCETFDAAAFQRLLNEPGCQSLRIYFGMSDDLRIHSIIVGVDEKGQDILPSGLNLEKNLLDKPIVIVEQGSICPPFCPPPSGLNP